LRLEQYKKLFGIGGLQYIDFVRGWADGLDKLLGMLKRQHVSRDEANTKINPNWEVYRRRGAVALQNEPERLTSNWLRIAETPDCINYFEPTGALDRNTMEAACKSSDFPTEVLQKGFVAFRSVEEINAAFSTMGRFAVKREVPLADFMTNGLEEFGIRKQEASNVVNFMFRQAWNAYCRQRGLLEYRYSNAVGFHIGRDQIPLGQKIPWGRQGERRSSMLRNVAKGHVWQFGITALPAFWPYPHFKLKSRVLFAPLSGNEAGPPLDDAKKQHRLRRTICKGWRNKQWHGRLRAFIELLSGDASFINLPLGESSFVRIEAAPLLFSSPVSTVLPNALSDEDEEQDASTLGRPEPEEEP
jgi:hypothetical protein